MTSITVRQADPSEERALGQLLALAFDDLPLHMWLVPDRERHAEIFPDFFQVLVGHALRHGTVHVTDGLTAAAVWQPVPAPEIDDVEERLTQVCGRYTERFLHLFDTMEAAHPTDRGDHDHLEFLVVHPGHRDAGIGSRLLDFHHAELDAGGRPAYLEATSRKSRALYLRHGYRDLPAPVALPHDHEAMFPMWRPAAPAAGEGAAPASG